MVVPGPACRAIPCILARPDDPLLACWCGHPIRECNARGKQEGRPSHRTAETRVRMADTMSVDQSLTVRDMCWLLRCVFRLFPPPNPAQSNSGAILAI